MNLPPLKIPTSCLVIMLVNFVIRLRIGVEAAEGKESRKCDRTKTTFRVRIRNSCITNYSHSLKYKNKLKEVCDKVIFFFLVLDFLIFSEIVVHLGTQGFPMRRLAVSFALAIGKPPTLLPRE